jgi:exosortase A
LLWIFRSEIGAAFEVWTSSQTFGHAFFIFPITLFLLYRLRHRLAALRPKAAPWALVLIAGAVLSWTIGDLANSMVVKQLAFVAIWQSLFLLVFGWQATGASLFPLAYLYLAVPFGLSLIPALQDVTAQIVVHLLRFSGVPVFLDGYYIEIPNGNFLVAEACSGVRYLIVCIALGVLTAYLFFRSWRRRILFLALAILVPIVANGIRAYSIVMIAYHGRQEFASDFDHVVYGFAFLSVVTLSLLGFGALLRDGRFAPLLDRTDSAVPSQAFASIGTVGTGWSVQTACAVLALAAAFSAQAWTNAAKTPPPSLSAILHAPVADSPWALASGAPAWHPKFHGTDAELQQGYRRGKERVDLHVGYYAYQREGAEAVSDLNTMSGGLDAKLLQARHRSVQVGDVSLPVNEIIVLHGGQAHLVWQWYWIGGENASSRLAGKLLEMKALATGAERAAAVIAVSTEVSDNVEGAIDLLNSFVRECCGDAGALFQVEKASEHDAVDAPTHPTDGVVDP